MCKELYIHAIYTDCLTERCNQHICIILIRKQLSILIIKQRLGYDQLPEVHRGG